MTAHEPSKYGAHRPLTARQREILSLAAEGMTYKDVGAALGITEQTVKNLLSNIYWNLGVSCLTEAFVDLGWLQARSTCGQLAMCGRPAGHRGHHGGFRAVAA